MDGKKVKVRLIGIDTPETVDPRKPVQRFGKEASAFTRKLLQGERVYLEYDQQKTDRYGRVLAYVYRAKDKLFVNHHLIEQGYAHGYFRFPFAKNKMDLFRAAEKEAREKKRGLWGDAKPVVDNGLYVTRTGKKFHRAACPHLSKSKIPITLEEAKKRGFQPCKVCKP